MRLTEQQRKLYKQKVLEQYLAGETSPTAIAKSLHLSKSTVRAWIVLYKEGGLTALFREKYNSSRNNWKIDPNIVHDLFLQMREKKAKAYGFPDDMWTIDRVNLVLQRECGVRYKERKRVLHLIRKYKLPYHTTNYTRKEVKKIITLMLKRSPRQCNVGETEIWSLTHVQELLFRSMGYRYSLGHIHDILRTSGYTIRRINTLRKAAA